MTVDFEGAMVPASLMVIITSLSACTSEQAGVPAAPSDPAFEVAISTPSTRATGFAPNRGLVAREIDSWTATQGYSLVFDRSGSLARDIDLESFMERSYDEDDPNWSIVRRDGIEARYHNDEDMYHFPEEFELNGESVSTSPYMTTAVSIDASGRIWASLHATVGTDTKLRRSSFRVFDAGGTVLFDIALPTGETFADAFDDRVLTVRNATASSVDQVVRQITAAREGAVIW